MDSEFLKAIGTVVLVCVVLKIVADIFLPGND